MWNVHIAKVQCCIFNRATKGKVDHCANEGRVSTCQAHARKYRTCVDYIKGRNRSWYTQTIADREEISQDTYDMLGCLSFGFYFPVQNATDEDALGKARLNSWPRAQFRGSKACRIRGLRGRSYYLGDRVG